jgi:hypothetical protein
MTAKYKRLQTTWLSSVLKVSFQQYLTEPEQDILKILLNKFSPFITIMKTFPVLGACLAMAASVAAHMELKNPPALRSSYNPYTGGDIDWDIRSPLDSDGSNFPCKGYASLMGTPKGKSVATWSPGGTYSMTITGNTPHKGGSCQASVSYDRGSSWKVIRSYIGNCPVNGDSSYSFTLPSDLPTGEMLFGWSWFNNEGNREMYMNCAVITVKAGGSKANKRRRGAGDSYSSRPAMFVANVGNGICTYEGTDVDFPQPGPDVVRNSRKPHAPGTDGCGTWGGN